MKLNIEQNVNNIAGSPKKIFEDFCQKLTLFKPYENKKDFFYTLASPVVEPIIMTATMLTSALAMAGLAAGALVGLGVALCAFPFSRQGSLFALRVSGIFAAGALFSVAAMLLSALLIVASFGMGIVRNVTRAAATIAHVMGHSDANALSQVDLKAMH